VKRYIIICLLDFLQIITLFIVGIVVSLFHAYENGFYFTSFLGDILGASFIFGLPTLIMILFILWVLNILFMISKINNNIYFIIKIEILFLIFSIVTIVLIEVGHRIELNIYGLAVISSTFTLLVCITLILKIKSKIILKYKI
jgi:hypothetical protein